MFTKWRATTLAVVVGVSSVTSTPVTFADAPSASADLDLTRSSSVRVGRPTPNAVFQRRTPTPRVGRKAGTPRRRHRVFGKGSNGVPVGVRLAPPGVRSASIGFDVSRNGFSFSNWSDIGPHDDANISTLRRLFDDESVCQVVDVDGKCIPFETTTTFLARLNSQLLNGRCEGLAVTAFQLFSLGRTDASSIDQLSVIDDVNYWASTQILPEARRQTDATRVSSVTTIAESILVNLRNGGGMTLGLHEADRAHTLLPISIEIQESLALIGVYETNTPGIPQTVRLNLTNDSWSYEPVGSNGSVVDRWSGIRNLSTLAPSARRSISVNAFRPGLNQVSG